MFMKDLILDGIEKVSVENKPIPVPYNYRIIYKIAQLVLIIGKCCGKSGCSLEKLHMISFALTSNSEFKKLKAFLSNKGEGYTLVRFDPAVNRAINFSLAEKIVYRQKNGLLKLTQRGKDFLKDIMNDQELLVIEKQYIDTINASLSEDIIKSLKADWRI